MVRQQEMGESEGDAWVGMLAGIEGGMEGREGPDPAPVTMAVLLTRDVAIRGLDG